MESKPYSKSVKHPSKFFAHSISVTSLTGTGSSTTLKVIKNKLNNSMYRYVSGGAIMRSFAAERGCSIEEMATFNLEHPEAGYDMRLDKMIETFSLQDYVIAEARLAHVFSPYSFHVLLTCDLEIRATRRSKDAEFVDKGLDVVRAEIVKRDLDDNARYEKLYPGCIWEESEFDLVVDTGKLNPEQILELIFNSHEAWCQKNKEVLIKTVTV